MKKVSALILAACLSVAAVFAQTEKNDSVVSVKATVEVVNGANGSTAAVTDTIVNADSIADVSTNYSPAPEVFSRGGVWYVKYDDDIKKIEDVFSESCVTVIDSNDFPEGDSILLILLIVFGIPCLTIIAGLIVVLVYLLKRIRGRNELIGRAIDANYSLPDVFYISSSKNTGSNNPSAPMRDSRRFYRAIALMSVGISVIVFAATCNIPFFYMVGGIPFLIGIGQMVGYFTVPTYPEQYNQPRGYQRPVYYQQPPMQPQQPQQPPMQPQQPAQPQQPQWQQPAQPTPPPYNNGNNSNGTIN